MMSVPLIAFFVLLIGGVWMGEFSIRRAMVFVAIWVAALFGVSLTGLPYAFIIVQVLLDILLILMIFGGDLRVR